MITTTKKTALLIGKGSALQRKALGNLERQGYAIRTATGEPAGDLAAGQSYDAVIADLDDALCFPGLAKALRNTKPGAKILLAAPDADGQPSLIALKAEAFEGFSAQPSNPAAPAPFPAANGRGRRGFEAPDAFTGIIHDSPEMKKLLKTVLLVAPTDVVVLIQGESGTGKELIARAIHRNSPARTGPFVPVNCGAIPETLLENELFGHERGSYTGAQENKRGLFEVANGGTLFLDEISETSPALQVKLLRAIDSSEIRRVGDTRPIKVSCRVVIAANKDLSELMRRGRFREDLYYRINTFPIFVPPLRARPSDIPLLAEYFLQKAALHLDRPLPHFSAEAFASLRNRRWPGNVRELRHFIERLCILCSGMRVRPCDIPEDAPANDEDNNISRAGLAEQEKSHVLRILQDCGGKAGEASRRLGISRSTLWRKLKRYGVAPSVLTDHAPDCCQDKNCGLPAA